MGWIGGILDEANRVSLPTAVCLTDGRRDEGREREFDKEQPEEIQQIRSTLPVSFSSFSPFQLAPVGFSSSSTTTLHSVSFISFFISSHILSIPPVLSLVSQHHCLPVLPHLAFSYYNLHAQSGGIGFSTKS